MQLFSLQPPALERIRNSDILPENPEISDEAKAFLLAFIQYNHEDPLGAKIY